MNALKKTIGLLIYKFSIIKKNRVVFKSYNGSFSDNPKYIYNSMKKMNDKLEYIWLIDKNNLKIVPNEVKTVNYNSIMSYYYCGTAKFIVDNVHGYNNTDLTDSGIFARFCFKLLTWLRTKNNQTLYSTWHGTPLKKIGSDQVNSSIIDCSCPNTKFLLGDEYTMKILNRIHFNKVKCELIGCPRNDLLYYNKENIKRIKNKIGLPENKKIVLFAPTFRTGDSQKNKDILRSGIKQIKELDFEKLFKILNSRFGGEWIFVCRFHYHVENMVDWNLLNEKFGDKIINGNKNGDMAEYLACSDVLITDVSSCMFDFMITNKPIFLYFPDYDHYLNIERGLYLDIDKLPFPFSRNFNELCSNINSFNNEKYVKDVKKIESDFNVLIDDNASERVARYILEENNLI